jgi:asparagine synthase (glutamine-hydrolysing)
MCGIAGIYNYAEPDRPIDRPLLERMTDALAHRGPDARGVHIDGPIGLGHRRLSIVDLSATGAQPMRSHEGSHWIIYNGELYNHREFREELQSRGVRFQGSSDTETLLYLMAEHGPQALERAAGIFGFAFWDKLARQLTLARDPLGVKQVYYHDDGRRIVFASEIKALLMDPSVHRDVDPLAVSEYLHFHTPVFERTFFKGIRQVRAGEYVTFGRYRSEARTYWRIDDFDKYRLSTDEQVTDLAGRIDQVVGDQLMADVPVAAFLSGGIDSTAVAAFASRKGNLARCFGVHFANQGVIDERPYQETAAKALGLDLHLTTLDGATLPEDFRKLLHFQDQPVIGPAMFPMYAVSRLAAQNFKVCLGGQASDEVFGGYARYALARPLTVIGNWFAQPSGQHAHQVGGNLSKQLAQRKNLSRLLRNLGNVRNWQSRYFESCAKVPLSLWRQLMAADELCDRDHCRRMFEEETNLSAATDPADKIMQWDVRTYLTGLFQQDDRMSMAVSLESRVPLADPRLVKHAFKIPYDLKFRRGATKWILREAIADVVPEMVLNRVKVGFDTPVEAWMRGRHAGFVRETLLSTTARHRGFWNEKGIAGLLDHPDSSFWLDRIWKALSIEIWAQTFLDRSPDARVGCGTEMPYLLRRLDDPVAMSGTTHSSRGNRAVNFAREIRELGAMGTLTRCSWEFKVRSGFLRVAAGSEPPSSGVLSPGVFVNCEDVAGFAREVIAEEDRRRSVDLGIAAAHGRIQAFGKWMADYGQPVAWNLNPVNGRAFRRTPHWSEIYRDQAYTGDIKLAWEAGRFPQCFQMGRAAMLEPSLRDELARAVEHQMLDFIARNPVNFGVHWASGQEVALRLLAWTFAVDVFDLTMPALAKIGAHVAASAQYIEQHIEYAQNSVYNNHLISEAFGLLLAGLLLPECDEASRWTRSSIDILERQADRQIYDDGAYISQSHNYHRAVLHVYLAAMALLRSRRMEIPVSWRRALERSFSFLFAQQNEPNGCLPNYGGNDGAMPLILSGCDYSDFRPTLQAVSVETQGRRVYPTGPWDEMAVWLQGRAALDAPFSAQSRSSVSFASTGYHILRGDDPRNFSMFRCGSLKDRFSQIDMLHTDVWWRGENVLGDPGTFLYNGPSEWHAHFYSAASHNTVMVDGHDQMLHFRQFKCLYPTEAKLLRFADEGARLAVVQGEHYGYQRHSGRCIHRRTLLYDHHETWVVVDDVLGEGIHNCRLHWQGGEYEFEQFASNALVLVTPAGRFGIAVYGSQGEPVKSTIACGQTNPPRGWMSRYYGVRRPAPSLASVVSARLPLRFVSVLSPAAAVHRVHADENEWSIEFTGAEGRQTISFPSRDPASAVLSRDLALEECDEVLQPS